ncbi:uncharacterized protein LOC62_01G000920 [Vanrija pseudolonga]|uniref:Transcription elongation factor Eaf N-terminal domain-containing protein n=1 Tax=Vanrija pseudolonga TaxID=143232 RepID=A0AAF0XZV5_9TREE|nr:hypothetical protein LOC62_01G000920 [Vanrija pseudolonga]
MSTDLLGALPSGTFALELGPSARALLGKRKAEDDGLVGLRYKFKPVSVQPETPGALEYASTGRVLAFDVSSGGHQVFDIREEPSKARECALVWDEQRRTFVLHSLPTTLVPTVNRTLSSSWPEGRVPEPSLAKDEQPPRAAKKARVSAASPPADAAPSGRAPRSSVAGKGVARKQLPNSVLPEPVAASKPKAKRAAPAKKTKAAAAPKPKAAPKKRGAAANSKAAVVPASKVKSEEFIEDSDDDAGDDDGMDEFANMLGEAVEQAAGASTALAGYDDDDDDDDDVEEDDDDELGGAHFAGYQPDEADGADVEWI